MSRKSKYSPKEKIKACTEYLSGVKYGGQYAQLYQWVRKYETYGEDSLADKRGKSNQHSNKCWLL